MHQSASRGDGQCGAAAAVLLDNRRNHSVTCTMRAHVPVVVSEADGTYITIQ